VSKQSNRLPEFWEHVYNARIAGVVAPTTDDPDKQRWGILLKKAHKQYVLWLSSDEDFSTPGHVALEELNGGA
jgi:hypothetical protein